MKNRMIKIIAAISAVLIGLSGLTSFFCFAENDPEKQAISSLKEEWKKLGKEVSVLYAVPSDNDRLAVTEAVAEQMKRPNCETGPYYMHKKLNWNTEYAPAGEKYYDLSDKDNLTFRFVYRLTKNAESEASVNGSSFCLQITGKDKTYNNYIAVWTDKTDFRVAQLSFNGESNKNMGDGVIKNIKVAPNKGSNESANADYMQMGCIYAYYTQRVPLPENTDNWNAQKWIEAAEDLELEGYDTEDFQTALTELREFCPSGRAYNRLIAAWSNMKYTAYETVAVPKAELFDTDASVYEKMGIDGGVFIGEKYTRFTYGNALYFTPADGTDWSNKDLSRYGKLYFYIRGFADEEYTEYAKGGYYVNFYTSKTAKKTSYPNVEKGKVKLVTHKPAANKLFNIEMKRNGKNDARYVAVTSIIGEYEALKDFPENGRLLSMRELIKAAEAVDMTGVSQENTDAFKEAIAFAKQNVPEIVIDSAEVERVKSALINTWDALSREEKALWAVPAEQFRRPVNADIAALTGIKQENFGPYYAQADLSKESITFVPPDGKDEFDSLANSKKITACTAFFTSNMKKAKAGDGVCVIQFDNSAASYPNNYSSSFSLTAKSQKGAFEKYFSGTRPTSIRLFKENSSKADNLVIGSLYSVYTVKAKLPYNYGKMSLPLLAEYAEKTDISRFDSLLQNNFTEALSAASKLSAKMRLAATEKLLKLAEQSGIKLDEANLISDAMKADLSSATDKNGFLSALYTLRLYTAEGFNIDLLKTAWENLKLPLPESYAQMTVEQWIGAAKALNIASKDKALVKSFKSALRNLIYYFTGVVDTAELGGYVKDALKMNSADFTKLTWSNFEAVLKKAQAVISNSSKYTQADADEITDELLEVWGKLKYYARSLYLDVSDYYKNDSTVKVSTKFKEEDTYHTLIKNLSLSNGLDCASMIYNISKGDTFQYGGQQLISLKGFDYIEFYVKLDKNFDLKSNGQLAVQLMCKGGREWFDYYVNLPKSWVGGDWQKIEIPVNDFKNYKNGKRQKDVLLSNTESVIMTAKIFMNKGSGTMYFSSMSAAKECSVTAGVVPTIPKIKLDRPQIVKRPAPKNPFVGLDRGDPWGDEYRANLKNTVKIDDAKADAAKKNTDKKNTAAAGKAYIFIIIGAAAVLAGAGATVSIVLKKKKNGGKVK